MEAITVSKPQAINGTITKGRLLTASIICGISIMFSGIASMLMSVYLSNVLKTVLGNVSDQKINSVGGYINSVFVFGSMFGGFAWGFICDRVGRSRSVILSTACYGLFTVLTAFSSSWLLVGGYRFLTGFGFGGVLVTTNILISELWPEKKKAVALGIISAAMPVGFIVAGAMKNLLPDWHNAFLIGIVPLGLAIFSVFTLPESESWKKNKNAPATDSNFSKKLFATAYLKNLLTGSLIFGAMLIGLWAIFLWAPTWIHSISAIETAEQHQTFAVSWAPKWLQGFLYALDEQKEGNAMIILAVGGLIGSFVSGWIANAIGLRKTMMMCFIACFIMTFVVFKLNTSVSPATFIEMGVLAFFFGISQGALSVYIPQSFPTVIRASATGFCFNIGRLFTATVVFFIGALVIFLGGYGNAVFIFSFIFLIGLAVTYFSKDKADVETAAINAAFAE